ncbi:MAG: metallophosphoesterase [Planctomycetales bacterium]|nr:metallophosphoesterase [Planctomycetales bacterium]
MWYLFALFTVFGHWAISIWAVNRLHSTALPYRFMKAIDKVWYAYLFLLPIGVVLWLVRRPDHPLLTWERIGPYAQVYGAVCSVGAVYTFFVWWRYLADLSTTDRLLSTEQRIIDVENELGHKPTGTVFSTLLASIPTNQVFQIDVTTKVLAIADLPAELDGTTFTHISDLHYTGRMSREFHERVVSLVNELNSDFVVITGDIIDKRKCFSWLTEVLGKIEKQRGALFVLGNHDLRIRDEIGIRDALTRSNITDLGGRWECIDVNGWPILFAGNELPWFPRATNMGECPQEINGKPPFRCLLSHSPDQIGWARHNKFELMFAGHTHGGQIRFPGIGPVFSPSRYGVKYASGTFYETPTLMHVSRGLSGCRLLRFNCRPEMTQIVLRRDS